MLFVELLRSLVKTIFYLGKPIHRLGMIFEYSFLKRLLKILGALPSFEVFLRGFFIEAEIFHCISHFK